MYIIIVIIIIMVVFGIISSIIEWIKDLISDSIDWLSDKFGLPMVVISVVLSIAFLFTISFKVSLFTLIGGFILGYVFKSILRGVKKISDRIEQHDLHKIETAKINQQTEERKKETARIYQQTEERKKNQNNELVLLQELEKNCRWLGHMTEEKWLSKLPNYAKLGYPTSFAAITKNFAIQTEQQNISQNDDWFQPFIDYIIAHPQGSTPTKMLNEVNCPQLKITHYSSDYELLSKRLELGTQRVSVDVPSIFNATPVDNGEIIYTPTKYLLRKYNVSQEENVLTSQEINFDDL